MASLSNGSTSAAAFVFLLAEPNPPVGPDTSYSNWVLLVSQLAE